MSERSLSHSAACNPAVPIALALLTALLAAASLWAIVKVREPHGVLWKPALIAFTAWHLIPWPCSTLGGAYLLWTACNR